MIRRRVVLLVAASFALGACTTFTDNDAAARVEGETLSRSDFDRLANAAAGEPDAERLEIPINLARDVLNTWIVTRIVTDDVVAAGVTPATAATPDDTPDDRADDTVDDTVDDGVDAFTALLEEQQAVFEQWVELDGATDEEFRDAYERGPLHSEVVCTAHVLVDTRAEADDVVAELEAGAAFADLAAERSTDPGSAVDGGALPCETITNFRNQYVPEYVEAALDADVGVPTAPVESAFGWHVILIRPYDEIADDPTARALYDDQGVRFRRSARVADIHVDPRYGAFDPARGVIELG